MDKVEELLTRGVVNIIPSKPALKKALQTGKKLNVYLGIDPTAPKIHLGHAVNLRKLQQLVELGHQVTFLIGDFTTKVGDSSDKESERPILSDEEIDQNFQTYKQQAEKILDFSQVKLKHNSEWLAKLTFADVIKLSQQFTLNDYISREIMKKKLDKGVSIRLDEVLYPIMQGYDSYIMDTDIQVGAADQTFNMQAGRTLQKRLRHKESFVLVNQYLTGTDGRKMSKSWGNAVWLDDSPNDIYGKIMSLKDNLINEYFLLGTNLAENEIPQKGRAIDRKKALAWQVTCELHSPQKADEAQKYFESTFQKKQTPQKVPTYKVQKNQPISEVLAASGLARSKSEAKRLIDQRGVKLNGTLVENTDTTVGPKDLIQVGTRRFIQLT